MIIRETAQFITSDTDPTQLTSYNIKEGDIWIKSGNGYIYVSAETVSKHTRIADRDIAHQNNIQAFDGGCWIWTHEWWQRSASVNSPTNFMFVHQTGHPNSDYNPSSYGCCMNIGFSV